MVAYLPHRFSVFRSLSLSTSVSEKATPGASTIEVAKKRNEPKRHVMHGTISHDEMDASRGVDAWVVRDVREAYNNLRILSISPRRWIGWGRVVPG